MKNKVSQEEKEIKLSLVIKALVALIIFFILVVGVFIYFFNKRGNNIIRATLNVIPYPAVIMDYTTFITVNALDDNLSSVRNFYEKQDFSKVGLRVDFTTEEGKKRLMLREKVILNRMVEDKFAEKLAKKFGIKVSNERVSQELVRKMDEYNADVSGFLNKIYTLYGWSLEDFQDKVVKPSIIREELAKWYVEYSKDELDNDKLKIGQARSKLDGGTYFEDVSGEFSDMPLEKMEDLNWINVDLIMPILAEKLVDMKEREMSDIIESETGFHILKLEERKQTDDGEIVKFHQIFVRKPSFHLWFSDQLKKASILIPLGAYEWNSDEPGVEFTNEKMLDFEKKIIENITDDPNNILNL